MRAPSMLPSLFTLIIMLLLSHTLIWWIAGAIIAAVAGGIIYAAYLTLQDILNWYRQKSNMVGNFGTIVRERLDTGKYKVVTGFLEDTNVSQEYIVDDLDSTIINAAPIEGVTYLVEY